MALTKKGIKKLRKAGRYSDGDNLFLQVTPSGGKSWLFRYEVRGRQRGMGLGSVKDFDLEQARARARAARQQLRDGIDPIDAKRTDSNQRALEAARQITFEAAARDYAISHEHEWTNPHYRKKFLASLKTYAFPKIGRLPVSMIDIGLVLKVIEPIWLTKNHTADRVRGRIENILDWCKVRGFRTGDNPARWNGHLEEALPAKIQNTKHHVAMAYSDVPDFIARLKQQEGVPPKALEFLVLTATRSSEVIGARWSEMDFDKTLWTIPAERMKERREHRVPLTERAIAILQGLPREADFVFIGSRKNAPLGKNSFLKLLWSMDLEVTTHGFRSSFRDWAGETTSFPADICEVALAHVVGNKTQTAYQRGDLLEKRRKLMEAWATYLVSPKRDATVTPIRKAKAKAA